MKTPTNRLFTSTLDSAEVPEERASNGIEAHEMMAALECYNTVIISSGQWGKSCGSSSLPHCPNLVLGHPAWRKRLDALLARMDAFLYFDQHGEIYRRESL